MTEAVTATEAVASPAPSKRQSKENAPLLGTGCLIYDPRGLRDVPNARNSYHFCYPVGGTDDSDNRHLTGAVVPLQGTTIAPGANFIDREVWQRVRSHKQNGVLIDRLLGDRVFEWYEPEKIPGSKSILDFSQNDALRIIPQVNDRSKLERWKAACSGNDIIWQAVDQRLQALDQREKRLTQTTV